MLLNINSSGFAFASASSAAGRFVPGHIDDVYFLAATSLLIEVVDFLGASRTDWSSMLLYWAMLPWLACVARASRAARRYQASLRDLFARFATAAFETRRRDRFLIRRARRRGELKSPVCGVGRANKVCPRARIGGKSESEVKID